MGKGAANGNVGFGCSVAVEEDVAVVVDTDGPAVVTGVDSPLCFFAGGGPVPPLAPTDNSFKGSFCPSG